MIKHILVLSMCVITLAGYAQHKDENASHNKDNNGQAFEAVVSFLSMYSTERNINDFGTEFHLTYWVNHKWAYGLGWTFLYEEENRIAHEVAALVSHKPNHYLTLNFGPSFGLSETENARLSAYFETEFAFKLAGDLHTGPTLGTLLGEEIRIWGGWHISYEF